MKQQLSEAIVSACHALYQKNGEAELTRPEEKFGDFSSNVALKLSKQLGKNPAEIAGQIAGKLKENKQIKKVDVAGPGFVNITLDDSVVFKTARSAHQLTKSLSGQKIVTEYSDPNPFKVLHAGHLYTSVVGDSISNLLETAGADVHRVNYGGDVGLHVAKTMWTILQKLGGENPDKLKEIESSNRADWLAERYIEGTKSYEENKMAKEEISQLNKKIYEISANQDGESQLAKIYWQTRQWSYDYFDEFYEKVGIKFERYYPESTIAELGQKTVKANTPKIYSESDGAIIYETDDKHLHTRVFITKEGLPTYEAKEVGLILKKSEDYGFDRSIVITANEISQYMQVVLASIKEFAPELVDKTTHLTHGMVKLPGAEKMSSRRGNIIKAVDILKLAEAAARQANPTTAQETVLAAVKYSFLKSSLGGDIIYDAKESVSIEGNSGPYLQYAFVRAKSILDKSGTLADGLMPDRLEPAERSLARKISIYPEIFDLAVNELSPHHICTYLYELAQSFNRFYETNRVIGDLRADIRLQLVKGYAQVLKDGLGLLGISAPEKM